MGYFVIDRDKEYIDTLTLIKKIKDSEWVDSNTIIVVCSPEYSSQLCQIINHSLSHLNNNEPFEMEFLEMPYPNEERLNKSEYSMLCEELSEKYRGTDKKLLCIDSGCLRGSNFGTLKNQLIGSVNNFRFGCLYLQSNSVFEPDYYTEKFDFEKDGGLLFWWENPNNPLWNW
jgi:hypothetical protein